MGNTGNVNFNITDQSGLVGNPIQGILFVIGETQRGPLNDPKDLITSWEQFKGIYGNEVSGNEFPTGCKYLLNRGTKLRVCRVAASGGTIAANIKEKFMVFDGPLVSLNKFNAKVNGTSLVEKVFTTDHDTTMAAIAAQFLADFPTLFSAVVYEPLVTGTVAPGGITLGRSIIRFTVKPGATAVFTDIIITLGTSQANASVPTLMAIYNPWGEVLFNVEAKSGYNCNENLTMAISDSVTGNGYKYSLTFTDAETGKVETLSEIDHGSTITNPTLTAITEFNAISTLVKITPLSSYTAQQGWMTPLRGTYTFMGGTDGTAGTVTEYTGDSALKTGFYAFDDYDDSMVLAAPHISSEDIPGIASAGEAYAAIRKDVRYLQHLDNTHNSTTLLLAEKNTAVLNSKYIVWVGGGLKVTDSFTGLQTTMSEMWGVLAAIATTHTQYKPWYSSTGPQRGVINGVLGVVNNFGSNAAYADLNLLANNQINMVVQRSGKIMWWDDYTGQTENNSEQFLSVNFLVIYIQKALKPTLEKYLSAPTDFPTFREIYEEVKPFLEMLKTERAVYDFIWEGDQFATSMSDLQINVPTDLQQGKYKINFKIQPIPPLKEITVNIIITRAGVSFE